MKIDSIEEMKDYIDNHIEEFPILFYDAVFTDNDDDKRFGKKVYSTKYKDSDYEIFSFYKPITRF
ncbi:MULTISPECIES: hypothetical protein [Flavobacterium]|uniref:Uncharacterized protein n=1 Tax=Flavobacterium hankyongi TaxID=1176532 RepID=A0ABP8ZLJ7_9FLAO|nr:hypothetical protein [Flavobacterium sp. N1846]